MDVKELVSADLMCVLCYHAMEGVIAGRETIACKNCKQTYPIVNNIPILIDESVSIFSFSDFTKQRNLFFDISKKGKIIAAMSRMMPSIGGNNLGKNNFRFLEKLLRENHDQKRPRVLVVGGSIVGEGMSDFVNSAHLDLIEADVSFGPRTRIVFDAHAIPYKNETFDCVIVQAVLEHLIDPIKSVQEIHRVLKPRGIIYAETPFMQQVHGGPYDFTRYSRSGH